MSDLRHTTFTVTVGDYDRQETVEEIRRQVEGGVRSRGFMTVDVQPQRELLGHVVLVAGAGDADPPWEPSWDAEVHTDPARAEQELEECRAGGHRCVLGEVRAAGTDGSDL